MIVDVHTHTPTHQHDVPESERKTYPNWRTDRAVTTTNSWADYDRTMADADVTIVFNIAADDPETSTGLTYDPAVTNTATAAFCTNDPKRRIGFMSVHPLKADVFDEVDRCVEMSLRGIKLGANYQNFDPLSVEARALYRRAEELGLPILFHQGTSPDRTAPQRYSHPMVTDEIALEFPELRIVMAHMGHPFVRETVTVVRRHPHVYADVSSIYLRPWLEWEALTTAVEWGAVPKLLLGSDFPIATTAEAIAGLRRVNDIVEDTALPRVPDEAIEQIIHADALGALGLKVPS